MNIKVLAAVLIGKTIADAQVIDDVVRITFTDGSSTDFSIMTEPDSASILSFTLRQDMHLPRTPLGSQAVVEETSSKTVELHSELFVVFPSESERSLSGHLDAYSTLESAQRGEYGPRGREAYVARYVLDTTNVIPKKSRSRYARVLWVVVDKEQLPLEDQESCAAYAKKQHAEEYCDEDEDFQSLHQYNIDPYYKPRRLFPNGQTIINE